MPNPSSARLRSHASSSFPRSHLSGLAKAGLMLVANLPRMHSHPVVENAFKDDQVEVAMLDKPSFWAYVGTAIVLVLLGGVFAGLTLGLMGQDEIYLQVIEQSGEPHEQRNAARVLRLLKRGKHWVLVTLLLSNVITNETLPIVLDRSLGGGWPAVLGSTVLIVIFGEIIPQSVCVRFGLGIGAWLSPFVLVLMYLMYPVAYPTALLLDYVLGEDHGTVYKKNGLKTLVTLHRTLGSSPADRLNQDEVTIISAVLDLKEKPVGSIMTPIRDVFTMCASDILDEDALRDIFAAGYSRIPIYAPGEETNFIGMLLVKALITYDPEDKRQVGDFPLATLPETRPETSCLDIVNFFQEGKSHMVLVSDTPGANYGALGVVTLEDVIEELIGEEIIDESDVYIDVHKAIRRANPSPFMLAGRRSMSGRNDSVTKLDDTTELLINHEVESNPPGNGSRDQIAPSRPSLQGMGSIPNNIMAQLALGPSNRASNPKATNSKTVMIKNARPSQDASRNGSIDIYNTVQVDGNADLNGRTPTGRSRSLTPVGPSPRTHSPANASPPEGGLHISKKKAVRSGSLIERVEQSGGVAKTIIETNSGSDDEGEEGAIAESPRSSKSGRSWRKEENSPLLPWNRKSS